MTYQRDINRQQKKSLHLRIKSSSTPASTEENIPSRNLALKTGCACKPFNQRPKLFAAMTENNPDIRDARLLKKEDNPLENRNPTKSEKRLKLPHSGGKSC